MLPQITHSNGAVSGVGLYPGGWPSLEVVELDALAELVLRLGRLLLLLLAARRAGGRRVVSLRLSPRAVLGSRLSPLVAASRLLLVVVVVS